MNLTVSVNNKDHVQGKKDAPVVLVEYGDFECPDCGNAYLIVKKLQEIEGNRMKFVFRNFPMSETHPHSLHAAIAAEAAAKQGKFWEMHSLLFENQEALEEQDLLAYAETLNLDMDKFKRDMKSGELLKMVKEDFMLGIRSGVNGTPTFFINGKRFDGGGYEIDSLRKAIDLL